MCPESIAGAFDLNDDGVMQQPIQQSGGDHGVAEHVSPFGKASIGGENHGTFFVASTDQLKEQIGAFPGQWQVADLIDDEQRSSGIESKFVGQLSGAMGQRQGIDQVGQGTSVDAFAEFERRPRRAHKPSGNVELNIKVCLAAAAGASNQQILAAVNPLALCQLCDLRFLNVSRMLIVNVMGWRPAV